MAASAGGLKSVVIESSVKTSLCCGKHRLLSDSRSTFLKVLAFNVMVTFSILIPGLIVYITLEGSFLGHFYKTKNPSILFTYDIKPRSDVNSDNLIFLDSSGSYITKYDWFRTLMDYANFPRDQNYGSHVVLLLAAAMLTEGPVLEMGCGWFSTPMLDRIAREQNRYVLTTETDKNWMSKFMLMESSVHGFEHVPAYKNTKLVNASAWNSIGTDRHWSLIYVDHRPGSGRRVVDIDRLRSQAEVLIVQDAEYIEPSLSNFTYGFTYSKMNTSTTAVSDTRADLIKYIEIFSNWFDEFIYLFCDQC